MNVLCMLIMYVCLLEVNMVHFVRVMICYVIRFELCIYSA